jgi:RNA polymerase sigma factor (sigma-70 family)
LLRLRSDDQLLALFRAGNDDAFRVIHDRYRQRLFAYTRQMLPGSTQDAEDALQDVFVRAYAGLRANHRPLALRPWLYRVAHNRCVDELRRPTPPPPAVLQLTCAPSHDPIAQVEQRESFRRLIIDLRRLPAQQRSALLMRELGGMSYAEVATAMDVSVPAVKSLLVRARIGLTMAVEARDTACVTICDELTLAHDRGVRCSGTVRRHLADCGGCRQFQSELRSSRRQFAALAPTLGPLGLVAKMLGLGGGAGAGSGAGAAATGGATATTGLVVGGGTAASVGSVAAGATHVATLLAAAVVTAGGAVAFQHSIAPAPHRHAVHPPAIVAASDPAPAAALPSRSAPYRAPEDTGSASAPATAPAMAKTPSSTDGATGAKATAPASISGGDNIVPTATLPGGETNQPGAGAAGGATTGTAAPTGTSGTTATGTTTSSGTTGPAGSSSTSSGTSGTSAPGTTGAGSSTGTGTSSSTGTGATSTSGTGDTTGTGTGSTSASPTGT